MHYNQSLTDVNLVIESWLRGDTSIYYVLSIPLNISIQKKPGSFSRRKNVSYASNTRFMCLKRNVKKRRLVSMINQSDADGILVERRLYTEFLPGSFSCVQVGSIIYTFLRHWSDVSTTDKDKISTTTIPSSVQGGRNMANLYVDSLIRLLVSM